MTTYRIRLDPISQASFLAEQRMDPYTHEPLRAGMDVVVCASCQQVFDTSTWTGECPLDHSIETLPYVPMEKSVVRFERNNSSNQPSTSGLVAAFGLFLFYLIACWAGWQFGIRKLPQVVAVGNAVSTFQAGISSAFSSQPTTTPTGTPTPQMLILGKWKTTFWGIEELWEFTNTGTLTVSGIGPLGMHYGEQQYIYKFNDANHIEITETELGMALPWTSVKIQITFQSNDEFNTNAIWTGIPWNSDFTRVP